MEQLKIWIQKIINILTDRAFWFNIALFLIVFLFLGWCMLYSLRIITKWGQSADVPKVENKHIDIARDMINDSGLDWEITDSVYRPELPEGTVVEVQPKSGLNIKIGRTVYLVVSTKRPPMVEMPALVARSSLRFAKIELEARGLKLGSLTFVPSPEKDAVLSQRIGNVEIEPGTLIPKGTIINLTLGDGISGVMIDVPYLIGKTKDEVDLILKSNGIVPFYNYDKTVTDTAKALVVKQYPISGGIEKLKVGEVIDVFLSKSLPKNIIEDSTFRAKNGK